METITRSTTMILAAECQSTKALSSSITNAPSIRSEISFLLQSSKTTARINLSHASILGRKKTFLFSLPLSKSDDQAWMGLENVEGEIETLGPTKVLRVKFQLQKKCCFGDQFLLVGDDPVLGSWNPSNAIPLNWSVDHIWTTEVLEMPIGKCIQYKFLLKTKRGDIVWQPGPDRVFRSWETTNMPITIREDWENAEAQKIGSEGESTDLIKEPPTEEHADETTLYYNEEELMTDVETQAYSMDSPLSDTTSKKHTSTQGYSLKKEGSSRGTSQRERMSENSPAESDEE